MAVSANLFLDGEHKLGGLTFESTDGEPLSIRPGASLHFLSVVETSKIPLHLAVGSSLSVRFEDVALESWFNNIYWPQNANETADHYHCDSALSVLVSVRSRDDNSDQSNPLAAPITELLLYASRTSSAPVSGSFESGHSIAQLDDNPPANNVVHALPLSSHLWHEHSTEPTPPPSPKRLDHDVDAVFLPSLLTDKVEPINEPPVRKRKSAADVFDEADDRRRKLRRKSGVGVAAAAAFSNTEQNIPPSGHRRSISNGQNISLHTRTLSRSPSVAPSRPPTAVVAGPQRSSLSRVESLAGTSASGVEGNNKELISRTVMAGMRLYGLVQKKSRKSVASGHASPAIDVSFDTIDKDRRDDEEFKLIYYQVYREAVRDIVDRLLMVFCNDPLANGLAATVDKLTPGGRKAFGFG